MSWDVILLTEDPTKLGEGAKPAPLGDAGTVRSNISKSLPKVDWTDPAWGVLEGDGWSIEFNHETNGITDSVMLHVRGGGDPIASIVKLCKENKWVAFDTSSGELLNLEAPSSKSWSQFQTYRDQIVTETAQRPVEKALNWFRKNPLPVVFGAAAILFLFYVRRVRNIKGQK